jgi:predicted  nucleic acid-binding Zn-ribbon protein
MQSIRSILLIALSCARLSYASSNGSPVEKVVKLLVDMQEKMKHDGAMEKATYEKFSCWCTGMTSKKGKAIEDAKKDLKQLGSEIMSLRGKVAKLSSEINDAAQDMKDNHDEQQEATEARDKENAAFTATRAELGQALQALNQALKMLKMTPQFLQTQTLSTQAADAVQAAISAVPDSALGSLPAAKISQIQQVSAAIAKGKYDPSYGSLVTILEEMYKTFSEDMEKETKTESKSNKDYEDLMSTKVKELIALQEKVDKKEGEKADAAQDLADTTQNYDDTESQMEADIKFFNEAVKNCEKTAGNWEERQKMRAEELAGVEKAIEILTSDEARELFSKAIDAGARVGASFLQVDAVPAKMPAGQQEAFKVLKNFATKSQSVALARLAAKVRLAQGGHFDEVIGAIDKVIKVLKDEQEDDNKKKTQCNDEYQDIAKTSADLSWKIEKNEARIEKLQATIEKKQEEKAATEKAIEDVKQEIKDMVAERKAAKEAYDEAKKDDEDAIKMLNQAKDALQEFYKKHKIDSALAALIQGRDPTDDKLYTNRDRILQGDSAPDATFSGKGSRGIQSKGISELLQSIIEGLEDEIRVQDKVEKESIASFKEAKKAAEDLQKSLEKKKTNLEKEIADRKQDKDDEEKKKEANEKDLDDEEKYHAKIKPDCDFTLENWQDRYNNRKAEMDGLVQAKDYLSGAMKGAALVATSRHS